MKKASCAIALQAISNLPVASTSKQVFERNHCYEDSLSSFTSANRTYFLEKRSAGGLVLKQRQEATRNSLLAFMISHPLVTKLT